MSAWDEPPPQREPKGNGNCLLWGCLISAVLAVLLVISGVWGLYWMFNQQVEKYTDATPMEMPVVEVSDEQLRSIEERIEQFKQTVQQSSSGSGERVDDGERSGAASESADEGRPDEENPDDPPAPVNTERPRELVLTAEEINALIARDPQWRGRVFVEIQDGRLTGKLSVPTDFLPGGEGRFFNADGEFEVSMRNGVLVVRLVDARVQGEPLPEPVREAFANENLAKDVYNNPEQAEMLRRFESIEVVQDRIVLRLREPEGVTPGATP